MERDLLIATVYNKNISNAEILIEFFNSFADNEQIILCYRLLFDQMIQNQHVYSAPTTTIAYHVFVHLNQTYQNNENLINLKAKLPQSLKSFLWNQVVLVINAKFNTCIIMYDVQKHDNLRQIPYLHPIDKTYNNLALNIIPKSNGKYFYIKGGAENWYMFADTDEFVLNRERRAVFGWRKKNETKEAGQWQLEAIEGSENFKIRNIFWNEYLSVDENVKLPGYSHPRLTTLRSGKCEDDNCKWNFLKYEGK